VAVGQGGIDGDVEKCIRVIRGHTGGAECHDPIPNWERMNFDDHIYANLLRMLFNDPTATQSWMIATIKHGWYVFPKTLVFSLNKILKEGVCEQQKRNLMVVAPSGTGKTMGFLLPAVNLCLVKNRKGVRVLIVVPTKQLANQIFQHTKKVVSFFWGGGSFVCFQYCWCWGTKTTARL